jgi:very-short-patch-repair endonuclease
MTSTITAGTAKNPTPLASRVALPIKGRDEKKTARAREMRKTLTPQETRLWAHLRGLRARGFHFRRQAPFKRFYLDFVCFKQRLVIEVDGGQHGEDVQAAHDAMRDAVLSRAGFRTLRFWNADVNTNFNGVMEDILRALGVPEL